MKALSLDTYVVMCRQMGTYHLPKDKATNLRQLINSPNPPRSIYLEMYDATLMLSDIIGVVTAERYDVIRRERKGQWKCQYETWHDRDETCRCGWGKSNKTPLKMPDVVNEFVSPEEQEKNKILLTLLRKKKITFRDMKGLKSKSVQELRSML